MSDDWIPIEKELPDVDEDGCSGYILISFENWSLPTIGIYVVDESGNGAFRDSDEERTLASYGFVVNAWMPLPQPYRAESEKGEKEEE